MFVDNVDQQFCSAYELLGNFNIIGCFDKQHLPGIIKRSVIIMTTHLFKNYYESLVIQSHIASTLHDNIMNDIDINSVNRSKDNHVPSLKNIVDQKYFFEDILPGLNDLDRGVNGILELNIDNERSVTVEYELSLKLWKRQLKRSLIDYLYMDGEPDSFWTDLLSKAHEAINNTEYFSAHSIDNAISSNIREEIHHHHPGVCKLIYCFAGIIICYSYFAVLQEKVTRGKYIIDGKDEKFTYSFSLVFIQCIINCLFAKILLTTVMKQAEDRTRTVYYFFAALAYMVASVGSNMALEYVNYPTQVIGKAGKPIPVMIAGVLLRIKTYPLKKYFIVILIVTGVILFMFEGDASEKKTETKTYGYFFIIISLVMDGLLGAIQDKMRATYNTKSGHMMLKMNAWSVVFCGVVILVSYEFLDFYKFVQRHPSVIQDILVLSACGALGQYFIFLTISEFGPLTCSIATTTRKCFTVVISVIFNNNTLLFRQWIAAFTVFFGLFLDTFFGKAKSATLQT